MATAGSIELGDPYWRERGRLLIEEIQYIAYYIILTEMGEERTNILPVSNSEHAPIGQFMINVINPLILIPFSLTSVSSNTACLIIFKPPPLS